MCVRMNLMLATPFVGQDTTHSNSLHTSDPPKHGVPVTWQRHHMGIELLAHTLKPDQGSYAGGRNITPPPKGQAQCHTGLSNPVHKRKNLVDIFTAFLPPMPLHQCINFNKCPVKRPPSFYMDSVYFRLLVIDCTSFWDSYKLT